ncbi:sigma-70 family RNA polymerase sigma factor [Bythopirellula polymerisocia]|uniref:ECF RNA polymerase sigma factor SigH n=1 Tax=Bythopirellula polymerisocia TaxID=2528003 RepID=A0A5C6D168_9BACT|nr:sigma-70 family RNA polymerase sigma factor [Bythopirellula polymerisocia]TWU29491.1 ECF RNA polymerase sigma factor SigH [Bythopirellula polymerisocia]
MSEFPDTPTQAEEIQAELERCRNYLRFLADIKLHRRLRRQIDPSDMVQETMLKAYAAWDKFAGSEPGQRVAWLRQILMRTILHALRDAHCAKRDIAREQRLEGLIEESSRRIEQCLAADESSPSAAVQQAEELMRVADAVYQLPEAERIAVVGYYWQGGTLSEISETLGRSAPAVAGLVHRGLRRLRGQLIDMDSRELTNT